MDLFMKLYLTVVCSIFVIGAFVKNVYSNPGGDLLSFSIGTFGIVGIWVWL